MRIGQGAASNISIVEGGNTVDVNAAGADALANTLNTLNVSAWLQGFNGSSWDRIRAEGTDRDAIAVATLGYLQAIGFGHLFNGASWDRQRALGTASLNGLGQLAASPAVPGASVVKMKAQVTASDSSTRTTMVTPSSGKRIRIISIGAFTSSATLTIFEAYFDTGANQLSDTSKAICIDYLDTDNKVSFTQSWPDGAGPVGAADDVLSIRNSGDLSAGARWVVVYREE